MNQVEKHIPAAMELIGKKLSQGIGNRNVPAVYKGYISSLGASIILSGLVPTLAFYNADTKDSDSEQARKPLLDILHELLKNRYVLQNQNTLLDYAISLQEQKKNAELRQLRHEVVNASIAVKLALRTFHLEGNEK